MAQGAACKGPSCAGGMNRCLKVPNDGQCKNEDWHLGGAPALPPLIPPLAFPQPGKPQLGAWNRPGASSRAPVQLLSLSRRGSEGSRLWGSSGDVVLCRNRRGGVAFSPSTEWRLPSSSSSPLSPIYGERHLSAWGRGQENPQEGAKLYFCTHKSFLSFLTPDVQGSCLTPTVAALSCMCDPLAMVGGESPPIVSPLQSLEGQVGQAEPKAAGDNPQKQARKPWCQQCLSCHSQQRVCLTLNAPSSNTHTHTTLEGSPTSRGLLGCILLIGISKDLGQLLVRHVCQLREV